MTRVLVTGGRDYWEVDVVWGELRSLHEERTISCVIHGLANGADRLGAQWAKARGVTVEPFKADWAKHGKAAGPIRNQEMIDKGKPDVVLAFPGGIGTADMKRRAATAGIEVIEINVPRRQDEERSDTVHPQGQRQPDTKSRD